MLKVCVNGSRLADEHPGLPVTAVEVAEVCAAVWWAGGDAVHVHVKDSSGRDTLAAQPLAEMLAAVRSAAPGLAVGVTTGAWASPDPVDRVRAIGGWTSIPDFASVNWHESGAEEVAAALLDRGVAVEAGLWHAEAVSAWSVSGLAGRCLRVLLELPDGLDAVETVTMAEELLVAVRQTGGEAVPVLLHGEGSSTWPALRFAARHRLSTRIGLEDTLVGPDGAAVADNVELVGYAIAMIRQAQSSLGPAT